MINPTTNTPDWNRAPDWAQYVAQEPGGEWDWYRNKPTALHDPDKEWKTRHGFWTREGWLPHEKDAYTPGRCPCTWHEPAGINEPNEKNWHKTLQRRPNAKTKK